MHKLNISTEECSDRKLLITLILLRYCPKLLDYEVEGRRKFEEETIHYAKKINEKYPFNKINHKFIKGPDNTKNMVNNKEAPTKRPLEFLKEIFYSDSFKLEFEKHYSVNVYELIKKEIENNNYRTLESSIAVMKIINDTKYNDYKNFKTTEDWLNSFK